MPNQGQAEGPGEDHRDHSRRLGDGRQLGLERADVVIVVVGEDGIQLVIEMVLKGNEVEIKQENKIGREQV